MEAKQKLLWSQNQINGQWENPEYQIVSEIEIKLTREQALEIMDKLVEGINKWKQEGDLICLKGANLTELIYKEVHPYRKRSRRNQG